MTCWLLAPHKSNEWNYVPAGLRIAIGSGVSINSDPEEQEILANLFLNLDFFHK